MDQYRAIDGLAALADYFDFFLIDQFGVLHDGVPPKADYPRLDLNFLGDRAGAPPGGCKPLQITLYRQR